MSGKKFWCTIVHYYMAIQNMASRTANSKICLVVPWAVFPVFGLASVSLPVQSTHFAFYVAVIYQSSY